VVLDGDGGGDRQPQPPPIGQQGDRADPLGRIRQRAGQPYPQLRAALGDRQPHPIPIKKERAVVEPDGDEGALAPRKPGVLLAGPAALDGVEPGVAVAAEDRPCRYRRQLPERAGPGQLATQRLIPANRLLALLKALSVGVQQPGPHVPGRAQQRVAAVGLPARESQAEVGSAVHQARGGGGGHGELMFDPRMPTVKGASRCCGQPRAANRRSPDRSVAGLSSASAEIREQGDPYRQRH
jgi:hypothetical protein